MMVPEFWKIIIVNYSIYITDLPDFRFKNEFLKISVCLQHEKYVNQETLKHTYTVFEIGI